MLNFSYRQISFFGSQLDRTHNRLINRNNFTLYCKQCRNRHPHCHCFCKVGKLCCSSDSNRYFYNNNPALLGNVFFDERSQPVARLTLYIRRSCLDGVYSRCFSYDPDSSLWVQLNTNQFNYYKVCEYYTTRLNYFVLSLFKFSPRRWLFLSHGESKSK